MGKGTIARDVGHCPPAISRDTEHERRPLAPCQPGSACSTASTAPASRHRGFLRDLESARPRRGTRWGGGEGVGGLETGGMPRPLARGWLCAASCLWPGRRRRGGSVTRTGGPKRFWWPTMIPGIHRLFRRRRRQRRPRTGEWGFGGQGVDATRCVPPPQLGVGHERGRCLSPSPSARSADGRDKRAAAPGSALPWGCRWSRPAAAVPLRHPRIARHGRPVVATTTGGVKMHVRKRA